MRCSTCFASFPQWSSLAWASLFTLPHPRCCVALLFLSPRRYSASSSLSLLALLFTPHCRCFAYTPHRRCFTLTPHRPYFTPTPHRRWLLRTSPSLFYSSDFDHAMHYPYTSSSLLGSYTSLLRHCSSSLFKSSIHRVFPFTTTLLACPPSQHRCRSSGTGSYGILHHCLPVLSFPYSWCSINPPLLVGRS